MKNPLRRNKTTIIGGIAMLDVISNALIAMVVLFFEMITIQEKPAPLPTTDGIFVVIVTLIPLEGAANDATAVIFASPPKKAKIGFRFDKEIKILEKLLKTHNKSEMEADIDLGVELPRIIVGAKPGQTNSKTFYIRNPISGTWQIGILYENHNKTDEKIYPAKSIIEAWFVRSGEDIDIIKKENIPILESTSGSYVISIKVPDWFEDN